jgi:hypothetical protein
MSRAMLQRYSHVREKAKREAMYAVTSGATSPQNPPQKQDTRKATIANRAAFD